MKLSAMIRKREIATATVATPATQEGLEGGTVAKVASVAVANQLLAEEESAIRGWLAHINETDPAKIADAIAKCRCDSKTRLYSLEQARQVSAPPEPKYTTTCGTCKHFQRTNHPSLGHCVKGEPEAPAGLWDTDWRWCLLFEPDMQEKSRP
jgi:hypothetical protein